MTGPGSAVRRRIRVRGIVQGVGFRPFVHRIAVARGLTGFVRNDADGVVIEVEGDPGAVAEFGRELAASPPPLAVVEEIVGRDMPCQGSSAFTIRESGGEGPARTAISPDIATCEACLAEVSEPGGRRSGYPFTNCTDCGPRFTITTGIPYDRPNTTMAGFVMCEACRSEYEDPTDRRFHAQPIACPACGPELHLVVAGPDGATARATGHGGAIRAAAALLDAGGVVAVKGLGGYHLAVDARNEHAVRELRRRKAREEKPLAVMVGSVEQLGAIARAGDDELAVLRSPRRPIVLLRRVPGGPLARSVAPGNRFVGVLLPYTPLHHLLLDAVGRPLVMTSGNVSDEPIAYEDDDAVVRLAGIADAFLVHDRPIRIRCDDSVVRVVDGHEYQVRRSRGYAPEPLSFDPPLPVAVLGAGAELKHTFCLAAGSRAFLSHHIGDLEHWSAMSALLDAVEHFRRIFEITPGVVAHDLHPEYLSTKWALALEGVAHVGVQHHHAHIASCLAEHRRSDRVIGLALDGTGYGTDGTVWGCEVLACDSAGFTRHLHLRTVPMPGAAAAVREPWRMAAAYLAAAFGDEPPDLDVVRRAGDSWRTVTAMARAGVNAPVTSSAGRLFDAVAAICGVRDTVSYEGQAAAELEQAAAAGAGGAAYPCPVDDDGIDGVSLVAALAEDVAGGRPVPEAAAGFHAALAQALVGACEIVREREGLGTVALSGGTWQNLLLLRLVRVELRARGFEVLVHRRVPPNDGGIALGQVAVAAARIRAGEVAVTVDGGEPGVKSGVRPPQPSLGEPDVSRHPGTGHRDGRS